MSRDKIDILNIRVNGKEYSIPVSGEEKLLDVLRDKLGLTGTKEGCGVGECGACTILMDGVKVNSCLVFALQAEGSEILTIEGLENKDGSLHPLQEAFLEGGAVQCGFCTPGMILSSYSLLMEKNNPSDEEIKNAISGNFCRCTGYKQIFEAVHLAAAELNKGNK
jgi:aerobic carbon-monoxide dehydrogenase small subunit